MQILAYDVDLKSLLPYIENDLRHTEGTFLVMKIVELRLETHLLAELREFYGTVLGLDLIENSRRGFTIKAGQSLLKFTNAEDDESPFYHFSFYFPANKLTALRKWLAERVTLFEKDGETVFQLPTWKAKALYLEDPAGNLVGFVAKEGGTSNHAHAFSASDISGIVQVGIAVDNVKLFSEHLMGEFNTSLWKGDLKKLAVLGSEEGMFMVVPVGHPWFPTGKPADYYPTIVDVE